MNFLIFIDFNIRVFWEDLYEDFFVFKSEFFIMSLL
jgi:hypothetical protein